jgi:hypothetical protein
MMEMARKKTYSISRYVNSVTKALLCIFVFEIAELLMHDYASFVMQDQIHKEQFAWFM